MPAWLGRSFRVLIVRCWPWLVLALAAFPAIYHDRVFPDDIDPEFPKVVRPTFNPLPPPAYRLAEPGDTIDHAALYIAAGVLVLSALGWSFSRRSDRGAALWPAALALAGAACWHAAAPGPCLDGYHGLGWRVIRDPAAPGWLRATLAAAALLIVAWVAAWVLAGRRHWPSWWQRARDRRCVPLFVAAAVLVALGQFDPPGLEPVGYWPRWAFAWGILAFGLAAIRLLAPPPRGTFARSLLAVGSVGAWILIVTGGLWVMWYQRPLERLLPVVPGRIYISAMPTYQGLEIAQSRHHFKTILNLFPEDSDLRSPRLPDEMRFVREHGLNYVESNSDPLQSDAFLNLTLDIARDPTAWPILIHCHGCMDRSPAWMGIYRFVVQNRPLDEILREIERHRGHRPKASVTLLYNRVLEPRAPEHYRSDPTAEVLRKCAVGTVDPHFQTLRRAEAIARRAGVETIFPTTLSTHPQRVPRTRPPVDLSGAEDGRDASPAVPDARAPDRRP